MSTSLPGRNEACPCGSGKKYKRCCGAPSAALAVPEVVPAALDTDEPSPDDPNFIPWMRNKIKDLPPEERREFERIMAAMLPDPGQAGRAAKRAPAAAPTRAEPAGAEPPAAPWEQTVMDPSHWKVLESAITRFPDVQEPRKRRAASPLDPLVGALNGHPEAPLVPLDEMVPWVMELAARVQAADKDGIKAHWWQLKAKPLAQESFNDLVQEAAERMAGALFTAERWTELTEDLQMFMQGVAEAGEPDILSADARAAAEVHLAKGLAAAADFPVRFSFLSLQLAFRQITGDDAG